MKKLFSRLLVGILLSTLLIPAVFLNSVPVAHAQFTSLENGANLTVSTPTTTGGWAGGDTYFYILPNVPVGVPLTAVVYGVDGDVNIDLSDNDTGNCTSDHFVSSENNWVETCSISSVTATGDALLSVQVTENMTSDMFVNVQYNKELISNNSYDLSTCSAIYPTPATPSSSTAKVTYWLAGFEGSADSPYMTLYDNGDLVPYSYDDIYHPVTYVDDDDRLIVEYIGDPSDSADYFEVGDYNCSNTYNSRVFGWETDPTQFPIDVTSGVTSIPKDIAYDGVNGVYKYHITGVAGGAGETLTVQTAALYGDVEISLESDTNPAKICSTDAGGITPAHETCTINDPDSGDYTLTISAVYSTTLDFTVTITDSNAGGPIATDILNGEGAQTGGLADTEYEYYKITVPSGASDLTITTSGGTGTSADLYHKYNDFPTTGTNDNNSVTGATNTESITIASPTAGDHYIGVYANGGAIANVNVTADFTNGALTKGIDETGDVALDEWKHYTITVPAGATNLDLNTSGGTGDVDLYTRFGDYPTTTTNDGSDTGTGNTENVTIASPSAGTYYVSMLGTAASTGVSLNADYTTSIPSTTLYNGQLVTGLSALAGDYLYFDVPIPASSSELYGRTDNDGVEDTLVVIYEKAGVPPTTSSYDNSDIQWGTGNQRELTASNPSAGTHYFGLYSHTHITHAPGFTGVNFLVRWVNKALSKGVNETVATTNAGEWAYYTIELNNQLDDISNLTFSTSGGTGDLSLYVEKDDWPTTLSSDKSENVTSNTEEVVITSPTQTSTYYVGLYSASTFSGVTLNANYTQASGDWTIDTFEDAGQSDGSEFGYAIDMDRNLNGDFIIVGAPGDSDAFVYKLNGTAWELENGGATLDSGASNFGGSVGINGDYAVVGTRWGTGNIYLYSRSGGTWTQADTKAYSAVTGASSNFGDRIDINGNYVIVGDTGGGGGEGRAFVFDISGGTFGSYVTLSPSGAGEGFGQDVATDGVKVVVGADDYDYNPGLINDSGRIYVWDVDGTNGAIIAPSDEASFSHSVNFGTSVDIEGDQIIVGALFGYEAGICVSGTCPGSAYIYEYNSGTWEEQAEIHAANGHRTGDSSSGDNFGRDVSLDTNFAIVGAPMWNGPNTPGGASPYGTFHIFERTANSWPSADTWTEVQQYYGAANDTLGYSVTIEGNDYYGASGSPQNPGPGIVPLNNASASSGGGGVPEFSDYVYLFTILIVFALMLKLVPKITPQRMKH